MVGERDGMGSTWCAGTVALYQSVRAIEMSSDQCRWKAHNQKRRQRRRANEQGFAVLFGVRAAVKACTHRWEALPTRALSLAMLAWTPATGGVRTATLLL
jgi:hypothetical protein